MLTNYSNFFVGNLISFFMSDLENQASSSTEDSPRPKRSRISKPLSQKNSTTKRSHTPVISEIAAKKIKSNKISRSKNSDDVDSVRFINVCICME